MDWLGIVFQVLGGLALFMFGIHFLSDGLKRAAGEKLKSILERMTNRPIKGVFAGAVTTAVIQSSSLTTVMLVGLINSGLLSLEQGVGVVLGAEIGTTITAQILAFQIGTLFFPIIALGFFLFFFSKNHKHKEYGQIILGFGILFLGMYTMSSGVKPLRADPFMIEILVSFGTVPILGVLAGAIFTGIVQSSSATTGLVVAMGIENVIDLQSAIAIILGANIGTCITALIASIGTSLNAKRVAVSHFLFNVTGVILFFFFIPLFAYLVSLTASDLPRQIANAHTIFNVAMTIIMLPAVGLLVRATKIIVPGEDIQVDRGAKFADKRLLSAPEIALGQAEKETVRMAKIAHEMLVNSEKAVFQKDGKLLKTVMLQEEAVDELDNIIEAYLIKISRKSLTKKQRKKLTLLLHAISDIERVGDHANNLAEKGEQKLRQKAGFSKSAYKELALMFKKTRECYSAAVRVLETGDKRIAKKVLKLETEVDYLEKKLEKAHLRRLKRGTCRAELGPIYIDIIRNLERTSDHARNIAYAVLMGF
ncbi:MAG: Na/Pi cotransporter family protein [Candidatus Diapherotrites archaeon]|nr:Na/Pi cotransporter family protein [Candidatus Diapherotrites archaeon]